MKNKKVIFIDVMDVISIPSKGREPCDYADFKLNYSLIEALRKREDIMRVNILLHIDVFDIFKIEKWKTILNIVGFSISSIACKAVVDYTSYEDKDSFERAASATRDIDIVGDESTWLIVGDCAKKDGVDSISLSDLINAAD